MGVQCRVLSDDQVEAVYLAALEMLERTGSRVESPEALNLLASAGAIVDGSRVRLSAGLVTRALSSAPPRVHLVGRDGRVLTLGGANIYFGTGSDCPQFIDPRTNERRPFTTQDVGDCARVADALPNIDFFMSLGLAQDVPPATYDRHQFLAMAANVTKPMVVTAMDAAGLADIHRMCELIVGGKHELRRSPLVALYAEPSSPLTHSRDAVEKLLFAAEHELPVVYTPCPISGATAPGTQAGTLAQALAECLLGLTVAQLRRPGAPVVVGGVVSIMDMATTVYSYGAPELSLMSAALTDAARWLRLPVFSTGGCSDAKTFDQQAGAEAAFSLLMSGLSGAHLIHDIGFLESALVGSLEMLAVSDEIIGMVRHVVRGISVDSDTLATEVVDRVGPGGHFLDQDHTLRHFRREFWFPQLMDRRRWETWQAEGGQTLEQRARARVRELLRSHQPEPLPNRLLAELRRIVQRADAALTGVGD